MKFKPNTVGQLIEWLDRKAFLVSPVRIAVDGKLHPVLVELKKDQTGVQYAILSASRSDKK